MPLSPTLPPRGTCTSEPSPTCRRRRRNGCGGATFTCGCGTPSSRSSSPRIPRARGRCWQSAGGSCHTRASRSPSCGCTRPTWRSGRGIWGGRGGCWGTPSAAAPKISCSRSTCSSSSSWERCSAAGSSTTPTCSGTQRIARAGSPSRNSRRPSARLIARAPSTISPSPSRPSTCQKAYGSRISISRLNWARWIGPAGCTASCSSARSTSRSGSRLLSSSLVMATPLLPWGFTRRLNPISRRRV
mmetsp:Transcript_15431/g.34509  ORF Transcript_15431/g.34509 Transcript_15431/m.34509 type:complete len:244 (+) Transcript_15431:1038-1769(+)